VHISNRLARLVRQKQPAVGLWINLFDPGVVQIGGLVGYDWVLIDLEHNPMSEAQVQGLLHAAGGLEVTTIVRVRANGPEHIDWVLDAGAGGVLVPGIQDAEDAHRAVGFSKYHPLGKRGYGPNRASGYWVHAEEYNANANRDILLICQIEVASAVAEIGDICQISGIDGIWIGPMDLAQSLGHLANPDHPDVRAAIDQVVDAATRYGMPWGIPTGLLENYEKYVERGGVLMTLGSDTRILRAMGAELVAKARRVGERTGHGEQGQGC